MSTSEPRLYRPRVLRRHATVWSVVLVLFFVLGFFAFPPEIRALYNAFQIATLIFFLVFMLGFLWALAGCYVKADATGVTYRNGLVTHRTAWTEVHGIRYRDGDSWPFLLFDDHGTRKALMGIMRNDGQRAVDAVAEIRRLAAAAVTPE